MRSSDRAAVRALRRDDAGSTLHSGVCQRSYRGTLRAPHRRRGRRVLPPPASAPIPAHPAQHARDLASTNSGLPWREGPSTTRFALKRGSDPRESGRRLMRGRHIYVLLAAAVLALVFADRLSSYWMHVAIIAMFYGILASSWTLLAGYA